MCTHSSLNRNICLLIKHHRPLYDQAFYVDGQSVSQHLISTKLYNVSVFYVIFCLLTALVCIFSYLMIFCFCIIVILFFTNHFYFSIHLFTFFRTLMGQDFLMCPHKKKTHFNCLLFFFT